MAHVQVDSAWARRLGALAGTARLAIALLAALLAFGLVAITFNTIRLQILTQRDEIEVSKLIGATDAFIRRPFYYLGALQGLAGGLLALAILCGQPGGAQHRRIRLAASYGSGFRLAFLEPGDALAVAFFSAALGWFGAYLSVSRYLLEIEPRVSRLNASAGNGTGSRISTLMMQSAKILRLRRYGHASRDVPADDASDAGSAGSIESYIQAVNRLPMLTAERSARSPSACASTTILMPRASWCCRTCVWSSRSRAATSATACRTPT